MAKLVEILLVEDNPADANLVRRQMSAAKAPNSLHVVGTGLDATAFLRQEGAFEAAPTPDLILLDLNIPGLDGREVLAFVKTDARLRIIPVVVMTSSEADEDISRCYELGANAYIRKPIDLKGYRRIVAAIDGFWLDEVRYNGRH